MTIWTDLVSMDVVVSPQDVPLKADGQPTPFRAPWSQTKALLRDELAKLRAEDVTVHVAVPREDFLRSGFPGTRARVSSPAVVFEIRKSVAGPLTIKARRFGTLQANLRAVALGLEHGRRMDRYGVAPQGAGYHAFAALPAGDGGPTAARGAELVREHGSVRRAKAATHPDHGGERDDFESVALYEQTMSEER